LRLIGKGKVECKLMWDESDHEDFEYFREENSFSDLRGMLEPEPKRGRVNKVLRRQFFTTNDKGHWIRKSHGTEYYSGIPSRPSWHVRVLPLLIELLEQEYGSKHVVKEYYKSWL
jgi:hypothetical protein